MPDLGNQIRTYLDETSEPISPDDVYERPVGDTKVRPLTRYPMHNRLSTGVLVGFAAAVAAILLVGIPVFLSRDTSAPPAVDTTPTTQATTTTIIVESAPTTIQQVTVDVAASVVAGLGTLTWERIDGDDATIPQSIAEFVDGMYVAYDETGRWESTDGATWTVSDRDSMRSGYRWFREDGDWAMGYNEGTSDVLRRSGEDWVVVSLPEAPLPDVQGITFQSNAQLPRGLQEVVLVDGTAWGQVAWGEVYGEFEVDCGEPEPCKMEPYGMWDSYAEAIRIENPENGTVLAMVEIEIEGEEVRFVDQKTGGVVHTVTGTAGYPAERIVAGVMRDGGSLTYAGGWVEDESGEFAWVDFPWMTHAQLVVLPAGGFAAFEFEYDWERQEDPLVAATVWTSTDGVTWTDQGPPGFSTEESQHVNVQVFGESIQATVIVGHNDATGMEEGRVYQSTDAINWNEVDSSFPTWIDRHEVDFGEVITSMPQSRHQFWVSTDGGSNWQEVEGPPGSHEPSGPGGGYGGAGAVGEIMFVAFGSDQGPRTLWIGRFEQ